MASDRSPSTLQAEVQGSPSAPQHQEKEAGTSSSSLGHSKNAEAPAKLLHRTPSRVSHNEKADGSGVNDGDGSVHAYEARGFRHGQVALDQLTSRVEQGFMQGLHNFELIIGDEFGPEARQHRQKLWERFRGKNRRYIGILESAKNVAMSSRELRLPVISLLHSDQLS